MNPQVIVGHDILTRIHYTSKENGLKELNNLLINGVNNLLENMTAEAGIDKDDILIGSFAGNTTMTHFLLGLTPLWVIREPYIPVVNTIGTLRAKELGFKILPEAPCFVFPNVGSYFGGDLIAGILAAEIHESEGICLMVDVGTNAEVVLGNREWLVGCAGAAGPALEGGVASIGMMAQEGAIDSFFIDPETLEFRYTTIGGAPPKGICGSGLIDLVSQLFLRGMVDIRGKFMREKLRDRLLILDGIPHLLIAKDSANEKPLLLGQPEIDALMRSKAAMFTILTTICNTVGITFKDIERFYVAGTFGSYIKPISAIILGMIPDIPLERFISIGNSSLKG
ncbi:MAG: ASKHA domain-containing protein, partial [bacterium]